MTKPSDTKSSSPLVEAFVVDGEGDFVTPTKPKRVTVPTFEISSCPAISIADIKRRRFGPDPLPCELDWDYDIAVGYPVIE